MKLTDQFELSISEDKLLKYLLSDSQTRSTDKSKLFSLYGFQSENFSLLKNEIISIAERNEIESISENEYGIFYVVSGEIRSPDGKHLLLQTIWHVLDKTKTARFVTAYPKKI